METQLLICIYCGERSIVISRPPTLPHPFPHPHGPFEAKLCKINRCVVFLAATSPLPTVCSCGSSLSKHGLQLSGVYCRASSSYAFYILCFNQPPPLLSPSCTHTPSFRVLIPARPSRHMVTTAVTRKLHWKHLSWHGSESEFPLTSSRWSIPWKSPKIQRNTQCYVCVKKGERSQPKETSCTLVRTQPNPSQEPLISHLWSTRWFQQVHSSLLHIINPWLCYYLLSLHMRPQT